MRGMPERRLLRPRRALPAAAAVLAAALLLSGCSLPGLYGVPLPGGADLGGHPYRVRAQFGNVLDLVPQSAVRVNDVPVGRVERIELDGWTARVTMLVNGDVRLPANARAELRQTSLLGEKFVALEPPAAEQPQGTLADGALIPLARTNRNPEVEEVLSALSALLTGGGIAQLHVITRELNRALTGRETEVRGLLADLTTFIGTLDTQRAHITRALEGLDRLSATLAANRASIAGALDSMPAALHVLADQRQQLTSMLTALARLGATGTRVINASRDDVLADLARLRPTLGRLADAGDALPRSLGFLLTFPFPDTAVQGIRGDYANAFITLDGDVQDILAILAGQRAAAVPKPGAAQPPALPGTPSLPPVLPLPTLPGVSGLPLGPAGTAQGGATSDGSAPGGPAAGGPAEGGSATSGGGPDLIGVLVGAGS
jgi:phospholipid/cholesterol/gamma-HCH transport system substrate-binding protein